MPNLRDHLLSALAALPGTRTFHIHVLVSTHRKTSSLYPFAHPRPKAYVQDVLVLLSEQALPESALDDVNPTGNVDISEQSTTQPTPRILVTAIEASIYHLPSTSSTVLYVSKVDSSGFATRPSPTRTLVRAFLGYYASPTTSPLSIFSSSSPTATRGHLWIYIFARAQAQYLFPNSSHHEGKKPLSDVRLCAWWRTVLTDVSQDVHGMDEAEVRLFYLLAGYTQLEAELSLGAPPATTGPQWIYGHPYSQKEVPLPCPPPDAGVVNIGHYIPYFDDDPKARFMDEIAYTTEGEGVRSPAKKRAKVSSGNKRENVEEGATTNVNVDKENHTPVPRPIGELGRVSPDEFWERMSFRQECTAGAVTGFFTLVSSALPKLQAATPPQPYAGHVPAQIHKRVMTALRTGVEFSTRARAIRATETVEGAVKGLCEGFHVNGGRLRSESDGGRRTPEPSSTMIETPRTPPPPQTPRRQLTVPRTPPRHGQTLAEEVTPNPFPEVEMDEKSALEMYEKFVYGTICVRNQSLEDKGSSGGDGTQKGGGQQVTVLAVRKKKKRE